MQEEKLSQMDDLKDGETQMEAEEMQIFRVLKNFAESQLSLNS